MRIAILLLFVLTAAATDARADHAPREIDAVAELRDIRASLERLERRGHGDRRLRRELGVLAARLERLEWSLTAPRAMDERRFSALARSVREQRFSDHRLATIDAAAAGNLFTVSQASRLLRILSFSSDRLEALAMLWPSVIDRENGFVLLDAFTFSHDRERARRILDGARDGRHADRRALDVRRARPDGRS